MGTHDEPRWCFPMDSQGRICGGHCAGCPRSVEEARPDDVDDGPRTEGGPDLRADFEALPREPAGIRRRVRQGLVQADAPRYGAHFAVPWQAGSLGTVAVRSEEHTSELQSL